ncbi:MAG: hypothetical protein F4Y89_08420 [Gammaproteobacteria bacterium]|nr:hypothetical protein [Gammaproteobacteria bacterium]MYG96063.1 hypothetical protein [Gammaproteobacteria bacterium]
MHSHATHRGFEAWILKEEDIKELLEIMGSDEDDSEVIITYICKHSARVYYNFEECKSDKNYNEDPIECVYLEVLVPGKGKRNLDFHHVGIWPSSATISIKITEKGTDAVAIRDELIRRIRRTKPWWSWISWLHIEKILMITVFMLVFHIATPTFRPALELLISYSISFLITILIFLFAIAVLFSWLLARILRE